MQEVEQCRSNCRDTKFTKKSQGKISCILGFIEVTKIMINLSIRLPNDMAERLKNIAKVRNISLNKLMFELSTQALAEEEAKQRFLAAQLRGNPKRAAQLLDELDALGL